MLNAQVAFCSRSVTFTLPSLVMLSPGVPVSLASAKVGAAGAVASTVIAAVLDRTALVLPARSVWRTRMLAMA
jgi:hypothetical protein